MNIHPSTRAHAGGCAELPCFEFIASVYADNSTITDPFNVSTWVGRTDTVRRTDTSKQLTDEERRLLKRRQAIEPIIGHIKADHRMDRCHLKGALGDALHAVLCAAGYNIRWLLRMITKKGLGLLLRLLQASGLATLFEKLTEFFGLNRLQNSDQCWALA